MTTTMATGTMVQTTSSRVLPWIWRATRPGRSRYRTARTSVSAMMPTNTIIPSQKKIT